MDASNESTDEYKSKLDVESDQDISKIQRVKRKESHVMEKT